MTRETIAFIGGGNMATSLVAGLISDGYDPEGLMVSDPDADKRSALSERFGVRTTSENGTAMAESAVLLLCVKPPLARSVCQGLALTSPGEGRLIISVMAGIREQSIQTWLGRPHPLVRTMPNTPAMIQSGAIVMHATPEVSPEQRNQAETILRACGLTRWVEREELLDTATALSGSGPAYFFLLMEVLERVGSELGLDTESARLLTIQTALGAARMAMESSASPRELRERVSSPGGTTERALAILEEGGLDPLVEQAVRGAFARSKELSEILAETP